MSVGESKSKYKSYVTDCWLYGRPGDTLFIQDGNDVWPTLNGYAIIPTEEYKRLREKAGEPVEIVTA